MNRTAVLWLAVALLVTAWFLQDLQAQEYRFVRTIGQPSAVGDPHGPAVDQPSNLTYVQVAIYDVAPSAAREFEAALQSTRDTAVAEPSFINERVMHNLDALTQQYATYTKFSDRAGAERFMQQRLAKVRPFCRRNPEVHLTALTQSYFPEGITDRPTGVEFGVTMTGQVAHLGLFIPYPRYHQQYNDVLHETKVFTRDQKPTGYIGEDILIEVDVVPPEAQAPYSPRPPEPSKMSINYGEYLTLENAEDSYVLRRELQDPKLITMERVFLSSLQVPTRFYIFQVVGN